ncbi:hypothetical protein JCM5353_000176 [Sporobolomyces roseus]
MLNRYFPPEIFGQILSYPATPVELARLGSVSRLFHTFVEPLLYQNVTVKFHSDLKLKHYITHSSATLLDLIRSHPETGRYVRSLSFRSTYNISYRRLGERVNPYETAEEVCQWATNISSLDIGDSGMDSLDDVYSGPHGKDLQEITMNLMNTEDVDILKDLPNLRTLRLTYLNEDYPNWEDENYSKISLHLEALDLSRCPGVTSESLRWISESSFPSLRNFSLSLDTLETVGVHDSTLGQLDLHQLNIYGGFGLHDRFSESVFNDEVLEQMRFQFLTITNESDDEYGRWTAYYDARDHEDAHLIRFDYGDTVFVDDFAQYLYTGTHRLKQIGFPAEASSNQYRMMALEALCANEQIEILSLPNHCDDQRTFFPLP